jgi:hypothetical protein
LKPRIVDNNYQNTEKDVRTTKYYASKVIPFNFREQNQMLLKRLSMYAAKG